MYCFKCGKKLNENVKFCFNCGIELKMKTPNVHASIENEYGELWERYMEIIREKILSAHIFGDKPELNIVNSNDESRQMIKQMVDKEIAGFESEIQQFESYLKNLYDKYTSMIRKKVINAYIVGTKPPLSMIYSNGESYRMTKQMIDKEIAEFESEIQQFELYLKNLHNNLIMLDRHSDVREEIYAYADSIGLEREEAKIIYERYKKDNVLASKGDLLLNYLELYKQDGAMHDDALADCENFTDEFRDNELKRLKDAIVCLEEMQDAFHVQSGNIDLSEEEKAQIYSKAKELGFRSVDDINKCIEGYKIKQERKIDL